MLEPQPTPPEHVERAFIDDLFDGTLDQARHRLLMAHLQTCADCRKHYARVRNVYRVLDGHDIDDLGLSPREADRMLEALAQKPQATTTGRLLRFTAVAGTIAAAAIALLVLRPHEQVTERAAGDRRLSLDVLCVDESIPANTVSAHVTGGTCAPGVALKPRVLTTEGSLHVVVVAFDTRWQEQLRSRSMLHAGQRTSFEGHVDLATGQTVTFIAVASRAEITNAVLDAALTAARKLHPTLTEQTKLPLDNVVAQAVMQVRAP